MRVDDAEKQQIAKEFDDAVNMAPAEIEHWLKTEDSERVGQKSGDGEESVGHAMGRHIIEIRRKKKAELTDEDHARMRKVVGYVHRHMKQGPGHDRENSDWRFSLMNWGHDPCK
jgi:DNA topoisomerase VI subunit B